MRDASIGSFLTFANATLAILCLSRFMISYFRYEVCIFNTQILAFINPI